MDGRGDMETALVNKGGSVTITTPGDCQIVITRLSSMHREFLYSTRGLSPNTSHTGGTPAVCHSLFAK